MKAGKGTSISDSLFYHIIIDIKPSMYTQVIVATESPAKVDIPNELVGHKLRVNIEDEGPVGSKVSKITQGATPEEILAHFRAIKIDTRGFKFDREEANLR